MLAVLVLALAEEVCRAGVACEPQYRSLSAMTAGESKLVLADFEVHASVDARLDRLVQQLLLLKGLKLGALVDLLEHGLQSATRAWRDGAENETVVAALVHDVGELMTPVAHGEIAAGILRPHVSPQTWWLLAHHEIFQAAYYGAAAGLTPEEAAAKEAFKASEHYNATEYFCKTYDETSFDPDYDTLPLDFFLPMLRNVLAVAPYTHPGHAMDPMSAAKKKILGGYQ